MKPPRNDHGRLSGSRLPKKVIRVLTEGMVTERDYIKILRSQYREVVVDIIREGSPPRALVDKARRYQTSKDKQNPDFDEIWCIFDVDQHPNIEQAIREARDNDINIAITNPCFELWLVLHYQDQSGYISSSKIQSEARRLGILKGKHLSEDSANIVRGNYEEAKSRAQRLEKRHIGDNSESWENPSSQMWKFVDRLARG